MKNKRDELISLYENEYEHYRRRVSNWVGGMVNAEDVVQEAFARALRYLRSYDTESPNGIHGWFMTILNNAARDFKREEQRHGAVKLDEEVEAEVEAYKGAITEKIEDAIDSKQEAHRQVLTCYFLHGMPPREIAEVSELTPSNIRIIIHRFKEEMNAQFPEGVRS